MALFLPCWSAEGTAHCELWAITCKPFAAEATQGQWHWEEYIFARNKAAFLWKLTISRTI